MNRFFTLVFCIISVFPSLFAQWADYDTAYFVDAWMAPAVGLAPRECGWEVKVQQNTANPKLFRIQNPYSSEGSPFTEAVSPFGVAEDGGYIEFDLTYTQYIPVTAKVWNGVKRNGLKVYCTNAMGFVLFQNYDSNPEIVAEIAANLDAMGYKASTFDARKGTVYFNNVSVMEDGNPDSFTWKYNGVDQINNMYGSLTFLNKKPEIGLGKMLQTPKIAVDGNWVSIIGGEEGCTYHYGVNTAFKDDMSTYGAEFDPGQNCTIYAYASKNGSYDSPMAKYDFTVAQKQLAAPSITVTGKKVTVSTDQEGCTLFYGVNSSAKASMTEYKDSFEPGRNCTVYAYAAMEGWADSDVAKSDTITSYVLTKPVIRMEGNIIKIDVDATQGVETYYSTDGTSPDRNDIPYAGPFELFDDAVIQAISFKDGYTEALSDPYVYTNVLYRTPTPIIQDAGNGVTIGGSGQGAVYFYRFGDEETFSECDGFVEFDYNAEIFAYAEIEGLQRSKEAYLNIDYRKTEAPTLKSVDHATMHVYLECATSGSAIMYRTENEETFTRCGEYIVIKGNETIYAYATSYRKLDSDTVKFIISEFSTQPPVFSGYDGRHVAISWPDADATVVCTLGDSEFAVTNGERIDMLGLNTISAVARMEGHSDSPVATFTAPYYSDETDIFISEAGQMPDALVWRKDRDAVELTLHGPLDSSDFETLRTFSDLSVLDMTEVICESFPAGAFFGMVELTHVVMPSTLRSCPETVFGGNKNLCSVTFSGLESIMPEGLLSGIDNPNILLYIRKPGYADAVIGMFPNIVYGGSAGRLILTDGYPFCCPSGFVAAEATYSKSFGKKTLIGECSGWEPVVIPFTVTEFENADKGKIYPFASSGATAGFRFWLYGRDGDGWIPADAMLADAPYLVSMPNSEFYENDYNLPGVVTFSARNVSVSVTDPSRVVQSGRGSDLFVPTYRFVAMTPSMQMVNDYDWDYDGDHYPAGSAYLGMAQEQSRDIRPFEWYIRTSAPNKAPRPILGSSEVASLMADAAIEVWTEGHAVCVLTGSVREVRVHDLAGQLVCVLRAEPGVTARTAPLTPGVYFAAGRKLLLK